MLPQMTVESFERWKAIFLEYSERPEEAPEDSIEKKLSIRELATNSWNRP